MSLALILSVVLSSASGAPGPKENFTVNERTYKGLQAAQEALTQKKFDRAKEILERLGKRRRLSEHERCLILQTQAVLRVERKDYAGAIEALREALAKGALPTATLLSMRFNLGQLLFARDDLKGARKELVAWVRDAPNPSGTALYMVAAVHARLEDYAGALTYLNRALSATKKAPESWLQLELACLIKLDRPRQALPVMQALVELRPKDGTRWRQLSALYSQIGRDGLAVAALELAFRRGLVRNPHDLRLLAENLAAIGVPEKAARVLEEALADKRLEKEPKTLMLLARCHMAARERGSARPPLRDAGRLSPDGEPELELARLEARTQNWRASMKAASRALRKGDLPQPGQAHLMLGIARHRLGRRNEALGAFQDASRFPGTARAAKGWLSFLGRK